VNVQAFEELKRVLRAVPDSEFSLRSWDHCACGHATRDGWFREQGFTHCGDFAQAAAFFEIPRWRAEDLFSAPHRAVITPAAVIQQIDAMLPARPVPATEQDSVHTRRQAIVDELLAVASKAAQKAKGIATALMAVFF
jgi:hypothetical protein